MITGTEIEVNTSLEWPNAQTTDKKKNLVQQMICTEVKPNSVHAFQQQARESCDLQKKCERWVISVTAYNCYSQRKSLETMYFDENQKMAQSWW